MKKLLLGVAVACIIGLTVENILVSKSHQEYSDLFLANVEALADHEWDQNGWYCWKYSQDDYSSSAFFVYTRCFDCYTSTATSVWDQGQCWH